MKIKAWIDGSGGMKDTPAGYAVVFRIEGVHSSASNLSSIVGYSLQSSSQRAELLALVLLLETKSSRITDWVIYSDNQSLVEGVMGGAKRWARKGWINFSRQPIANMDLWARILEGIDRQKSVMMGWIPRNSCEEHVLADTLSKHARIYGPKKCVEIHKNVIVRYPEGIKLRIKGTE